jgi:hypothetical protein
MMSDSEENLDIVDDAHLDRMTHEYKVRQLREKKQRLISRQKARAFKRSQREEIRAEKRAIRGMRHEEFRERAAPVKRMVSGVGSGMARAGQGFARSMERKGGSSGGGPQPRGMFGQGSGGGLSLGFGGSSKFDMSMGHGKKPYTFGGGSGGLSLGLGSKKRGSKRGRKK